MARTVVIISDLHIGRNDGFDIFRSDTKPAQFSTFLRSWAGRSVELVINGDFVDFLQLRPWDIFDRRVACTKIRDIVSRSLDVFAMLGEFLRDPAHQISVLLGNHDAELAYDEVWAEVRTAILTGAQQAADRLEFVDRRTTLNRNVNGVLVHIEHGNGDDPWNAINYNVLFQDAELQTKKYAPPPGTKLVFEIMNGFKEQFQFVDLLKPEVPAVPLILLALRPVAASMAFPPVALKALDSIANGMLGRLRRLISGAPLGGDRAEGTLDDVGRLGSEVAGVYASSGVDVELKMTNSDVDALASFLEGTTVPTPADIPTLGPRWDGVKMRLLRSALRGLDRFTAARHGREFFRADHLENPVAKSARTRLVGKVQLVVFGHTHEALKVEFPEGTYINSGTWANLVKLPANDAELSEWLTKVANNEFERTSFPTYVRVDPLSEGVSASLNLWRDGAEDVLWHRMISPSK